MRGTLRHNDKQGGEGPNGQPVGPFHRRSNWKRYDKDLRELAPECAESNELIKDLEQTTQRKEKGKEFID